MPKLFSAIFGGSPALGDAVASPGNDCILTLGGDVSPEIWQIERIVATYAIPNAIDFENPAALYRSFSGRLTVFDGVIPDSFSPAVVPNTALYTRYPDEFQTRILFDIILNSFDKPFIFDFPSGDTLGSLRSSRGRGISVVMLAGQHFNGAGAAAYLSLQMLHVIARKDDADSAVTIGPFSTRR